MSDVMPVGRTYLPALDGLRAIAVALVIAYHLDLPWAHGGFLGVDLFFVISGFLITTLLLDEQRTTGRIALGSFWLRRFRRLVPPLVAVVAATVVATRLWGVEQQWQAVRSDSVASLGYVANWRFVLADQSYFDTLLGPSPLRHMWSLAVEEQWYLLWPIAMIALVALGRRTTRISPLTVVLAAAVASAALMALLFDPDDASRVYYGTDTRAQQLLTGAALAWAVVRWPQLSDVDRLRSRRVPLTAALVLFVLAALFVDDQAAWLYRGGLLALSMLAAVVVLATSVPERGPLGWLGAAPLVNVGRRSYGLYLWHWPVIVFVGPPMGLDIGRLPLIVVQLVVTAALTEASYRFIETRARHSRRHPITSLAGWTAGAAATALIATFVLTADIRSLPDEAVLLPDLDDRSTTIGMNDPADAASLASDLTGSPTRPADDHVLADAADTSPTADAADTSPTADATDTSPTADATDTFPTADAADTSPTANAASLDVATDDPQPSLQEPMAAVGAGEAAAAQSSPTRNRLLVVGDSTAFVLAVDKPAGGLEGWQSDEYARIGCAITDGDTIDVGDDRVTDRGEADDCGDWFDDWSLYAGLVDPTLTVVMIGAWEVLDHQVDGVRLSFPSPEWTEHVRSGVERSLDAASLQGNPVAFLRLPCMEQADGAEFNAQARNDPARVAAFNDILESVAATSDDVVTLPLDELLCPDGEPVQEIGGDEIRYDGVHLTPAGSEIVWKWLGEQIAPFSADIAS